MEQYFIWYYLGLDILRGRLIQTAKQCVNKNQRHLAVFTHCYCCVCVSLVWFLCTISFFMETYSEKISMIACCSVKKSESGFFWVFWRESVVFYGCFNWLCLWQVDRVEVIKSHKREFDLLLQKHHLSIWTLMHLSMLHLFTNGSLT